MNVKPALRHAIATMLAFSKRERRLMSQEDGVNNFGTGIQSLPLVQRVEDARQPVNVLFTVRRPAPGLADAE